MKDEARQWVDYGRENLRAAEALLSEGLFNGCLQNCQQAVEKLLKALVIERGLKFAKTHSIAELRNTLQTGGVSTPITDEDADLLDSIYLPSKYPVANVLPDYAPDAAVCQRCLTIGNVVAASVGRLLQDP